MNTADLHRVIQVRLRAVDQRYTHRRRQLVELLRASAHPVHIPEILAADPALAQSSVYRNLGVLEHAGVVQRVLTNDAFGRFELAEDLSQHHHHLICSVCGTVLDVEAPADVERVLDASLADLAASNGFTLESHRLDLIGRCAQCR